MKKSISRKLLSVVLLITVFLSTVLAGNVSHAAEVPPAADSNTLTVADDFIVLTGAGASQKIELQNADTPDPAAPQEDIFYTSSRASVATVSDDGTITAVSEGLADVSVRIGDKTKPNDAETVATIKVTVVPEKDASGRVKVGLQMYNLFTGGDLGWGETSKDKVIDALRKVASLGYDGVEFANLSGAAGQFYANTGMSISELKAVLEELGLEAPSSHYHYGGSLDSPANIDAIVKANQELGCENLIFAWSTPQSPVQHDTNAQWVEWINSTLAAMQEGVQRNNSNARVLYHNHGDEFMTMEGTETLCMDNVNGDSLEIDMYWASRGLNSTDKAVKWASDNADKISFLHIKDGGLDGSIRPWGKGSMPVQSFVDVARKNNIGWVIVENDSPASYLDHNGLQDAAVSMEYIKNNINLNYTSAKVDDDFIVLTGAGATQSIQTTVSAENTVSYTSSNRNVATVAEDGTVTAVTEGLADIAVTINDASGKAITSATVKVTVVPKKDTTGRVKVGLQMYNLRQGGDIGRNETSKDKVIDAMRKIASLGYDGIEFANLSGAAGQFYAETGMSVTELKSVLNELGLETPSSHYHFKGSLDEAANIDAIVKANQELGSENIIFAFSNPSNPVQHETNAKWVEWINSTLAAMQDGVKRNNSTAKVLYHNHGDEFKTMEGTDTLCMDNIKGDSMEIDMYWASRGLESTDQAVRWASDHADKISFLHIKDGGLDGSIRPWGKGSMPVQKFVDVARKNNIGWVIVENDSPSSYLNHNGLQDAEVSMNYIKSNINLSYNSFKVDNDFVVLTGANATQKIQATAPAESTLSYTTSNRNVATVAADGTVTAVAEGLADITVAVRDKSDKTTSTATVKVTVIPKKDAAGRVKVGLQMYNLFMGGDIGWNETSKDKVIDALRKVASLGYDGVEFANLSGAAGQFYANTGLSIAELKSVLSALGLEAPSSHYHFRGSLDEAANIDAIVKANQELGCENIIFAYSNPSNPVQHETNAKWVEWINSTLTAMQEGVKRNNSNAKILYHNHGDEFKTMEGTNTLCMDNVKGDTMEIDMYWASRGLESPDKAVKWASDNAKKISFLHIKDGGLDGSIRPWGKGSMPVQSFVDIARKNNIGWVIVENDSPSSYLNHNGLQDAEVSMEYIKNNMKLNYISASDDPVTPPVNTAVKVSGIKVSGMSKKIAAGKKVTLTAAVSPSNAANKAVTWKSSNTNLAKVNSKGVVTLNKKSGGKSVTITATAQDGSGVKGTYKITSMKGKVKKVTITGKKSVTAGKSLKLTGKVTAEKKANKTLKWTSSNKKYATVNSSGKVKTYKAGRGKNVKITATATDGTGKKRTVTIKIKK